MASHNLLKDCSALSPLTQFLGLATSPAFRLPFGFRRPDCFSTTTVTSDVTGDCIPLVGFFLCCQRSLPSRSRGTRPLVRHVTGLQLSPCGFCFGPYYGSSGHVDRQYGYFRHPEGVRSSPHRWPAFLSCDRAAAPGRLPSVPSSFLRTFP